MFKELPPLIRERWLEVAGWAAASGGVLAIVLAYIGVRTPTNIAAQIPYLASGGFLGAGLLAFGGALVLAGRLAEAEKRRLELHEQILETLLHLRSEEALEPRRARGKKKKGTRQSSPGGGKRTGRKGEEETTPLKAVNSD